jgi:hypothetical protein
MKIAILYICTGKYDVFWKEFFESYEEYFLPNSQKEYFVFTDAETLYAENECNGIHKIYQKQLGWPDDTLMRFHMFDSISEQLEKFDFIYFMNANCKCVTTITEEEFLPKDKDIVVVQHPGYYNKNPKDFVYDRNPKSTAYIPKNQGQYYICGGINGGKSQAYLKLIKELKNNIDIDKSNGVIAKWHDESHINRYILNHDNWEIKSPEYCCAEGWELPFKPRILVREKSKYFDSFTMKNGKLAYIKRKISKLIIDKIGG